VAPRRSVLRGIGEGLGPVPWVTAQRRARRVAQFSAPAPAFRATVERMQLTPHFSDTELGVAGCEDRIVGNARFLCTEVLEPLRDKFGAIQVHYGYRPPAHNAQVGGKANSFHLFDDGHAAADVGSPAATFQELFDWLRLESGLPFDKVILETGPTGAPACVHIQIDSINAPRRQAFTGQTGAGTVYIAAEVRDAPAAENGPVVA